MIFGVVFMNLDKIIYAHFENKRIFAISDLHGDLKIFEQFLKEFHFSCQDVLIIVGDMIEKGKDSLKLIQRIMQLQKEYEIYVLKGNNEENFLSFFDSRTSSEAILNYLQYVQNSLFLEMASALNYSIKSIKDVEACEELIQQHFNEELTFLKELPIILDCDEACFVHAGLQPIDLALQEEEFCLNAKAFGQSDFIFTKPVVCGHWPSSNYRQDKINANIYFNEKSNIYSIDGGISMKPWQQLNVLMIENHQFHTYALDNLDKITATHSQLESDSFVTCIFPHTQIEIMHQDETKVLAYVPYLKQSLLFDYDEVYSYKGKFYCNDFTDYHLKVDEKDVLAYCNQKNLYKKDGIIGYYEK